LERAEGVNAAREGPGFFVREPDIGEILDVIIVGWVG
jgi:hypothetical protein